MNVGIELKVPGILKFTSGRAVGIDDGTILLFIMILSLNFEIKLRADLLPILAGKHD